MADFEEKKRKLATWIKWGLGLVVAAVAAPVVFLAVKSIVGIGMALLLVWGIGILVTQVLPAASFVISNAVMKLIKWEAKRNPIETLQNQEVEKRAELENRLKNITDLETNVRNFRSKVKSLKERFPNDASEFDEQVQQLEAILQDQRRSYREAETAVDRFHMEIEKAQAKWDVAMSAQGAFKSAGRAAKNAMDLIKKETALGSVELEMNRAFAQLSSAVSQPINTTPQLGSGRMVSVEVLDVREKELKR